MLKVYPTTMEQRCGQSRVKAIMGGHEYMKK
jgi:hypothetical protein